MNALTGSHGETTAIIAQPTSPNREGGIAPGHEVAALQTRAILSTRPQPGKPSSISIDVQLRPGRRAACHVCSGRTCTVTAEAARAAAPAKGYIHATQSRSPDKGVTRA